MHYFKGEFWLDVIACFPIDLFLVGATGTVASSRGLFRLPRMLRLHRFWSAKITLVMSKNFKILIIRNLVYFCLFCHWMGGLFFYVGQSQKYGNIYTGQPWVVAANISNADATTKVVTSFYYAVVTSMSVGYGDIRYIWLCVFVCECVFL